MSSVALSTVGRHPIIDSMNLPATHIRSGHGQIEVQHLLTHTQVLVERNGWLVAVVRLHEHGPRTALMRDGAQSLDQRRSS